MKDTLDTLFRLQKLDDEIDALEKEKATIPGDREEIDGKLEEMEQAIQKIKDETIDVAKLRDEKEIDLKQMGEQINKFQGQLYQVKTNREYESLQHEIDALKEKSSKIEDQVLELLENMEKISATAAEEEKKLGEYKAEAAKDKAALEARDRELSDQIAIKHDERKRLVVNIDQSLLSRYDRIREKKAGLAVAVVENGACGGCFRRIPPQETQELKMMERIMTCEGCGRIIVWRDE
jgi:predicted  nucleic acid-binding Zn-ribbon protein